MLKSEVFLQLIERSAEAPIGQNVDLAEGAKFQHDLALRVSVLTGSIMKVRNVRTVKRERFFKVRIAIEPVEIGNNA